jgi:protein-S-isoprenylcysteine O-methyltransferase Ste14
MNLRNASRRLWRSRGGRLVYLGLACLVLAVPLFVGPDQSDNTSVNWESYAALVGVVLVILGLDLIFVGFIRNGRWQVGLGIVALVIACTAIFTTDWPYYGRTSPADDPCFGFTGARTPKVPKGHVVYATSSSKELTPPGVRCDWRECVAQSSGRGCRTLVGTPSRFVPAKFSAYLVLAGGSSIAVAVLVIPVVVGWFLIWFARRTGTRWNTSRQSEEAS